jgi:hypothetical protein
MDMPAVYAHYLFGKKVFRALPKEEKQLIRKERDAYLLGLHGPDLLFYYYPICKNRINQQGVRLHKELAADFFDRGHTLYDQKKDETLRAYLYGFLCHFILDSECHPYVQYYMEEKHLGHLEIETELDRYLMKLQGMDPLRDVPVKHLISTAHTRKMISMLFDRITPRQIDICIHSFRRIIHVFTCRTSSKRILFRMISRMTGQEKELGGLIMDGRVHKACEESDRFLEERLEQSVKLAAEQILEYSRVLDGNALLSERLYRNYEEFLEII